MAAIDLTNIYKRYKGKWVALAEDEQTVIASGEKASITYKKARAKGVKKPIMMKVPKEIISYVGYAELE